MPRPDACELFLLDGLKENLAEREGFYFRRLAIVVITKTQVHSSQHL